MISIIHSKLPIRINPPWNPHTGCDGFPVWNPHTGCDTTPSRRTKNMGSVVQRVFLSHVTHHHESSEGTSGVSDWSEKIPLHLLTDSWFLESNGKKVQRDFSLIVNRAPRVQFLCLQILNQIQFPNRTNHPTWQSELVGWPELHNKNTW